MTTQQLEAPETFMGVPTGLPGPGCRAAIVGLPFDCGTHPFRVGARQGPTGRPAGRGQGAATGARQ